MHSKCLLEQFRQSTAYIAKVSSSCLRYFPAAMLVPLGGTPTYRLHTGLCKLMQNISASIWSLGKPTDLKLGEMSYLFISCNILISWRYTLNGSDHGLFFNCVTVEPNNCNMAKQTAIIYIQFKKINKWKNWDFWANINFLKPWQYAPFFQFQKGATYVERTELQSILEKLN